MLSEWPPPTGNLLLFSAMWAAMLWHLFLKPSARQRRAQRVSRVRTATRRQHARFALELTHNALLAFFLLFIMAIVLVFAVAITFVAGGLVVWSAMDEPVLLIFTVPVFLGVCLIWTFALRELLGG